MAAKHNLTIDQGSTFKRALTIKSGDTGAAIDITGSTISGQIRESVDSETIIAEFTGTVTTPVSGQCEVSLTATQTTAIPSGTYVYDIEWEDVNGNVTRLIEGKATVTPEVTR